VIIEESRFLRKFPRVGEARSALAERIAANATAVRLRA
jgi:hypothetical protein